MEKREFDIIVVGGGLAGLVTSLNLSLNGKNVVLFEQKQYPFHKVCGEYISNEVLPYLKRIGVDPFEARAKRITQFELTSPKGRKISAKLPLGGFSISRFTFDDYIHRKSKAAGTHVVYKKVIAVNFINEKFQVRTNDNTFYSAKVVIGSFGKKSVLDNFFDRKFVNVKSKYIAVKYHAEYDYPEDLVALHNFQSGYCGVSQVESGHVNICYLSTQDNLKKAGNLENLEKMIMSKNKHLREVILNSKSVFKTPLTISNVSFDKKSLIQDHVIMAGDSAGMISPLCGNGMTMAIHSGKMISEEVTKFLEGTISREEMEKNYITNWKKTFNSRLFWGRQLQKVFGLSFMFEFASILVKLFPPLFTLVIKQTHGEVVE